MKKALLIFIYMFAFSGYSQAEKDSLLAKDYSEVYKKLKFMHYLEDTVLNLYTMDEYEGIAVEKTFQYYLKKNIIANNPVTSIDVLKYLEVYVQKDIPSDSKSFIRKANNANAKSLIEITEKYGYPSKERITKYVGFYDLPSLSINFAIRKNRYFNDLKKLLKKEVKKGNMKKSEYEIFVQMDNREALPTAEMLKISKGKFTIALD